MCNLLALKMTLVSEWFANERKQETESHSFCLPVSFALFPSFSAGQSVSWEILWLFKDMISCLAIYNCSGLCKQRIYVRTRGVMKLFVDHRVVIGTLEMPFSALQCVDFQSCRGHRALWKNTVRAWNEKSCIYNAQYGSYHLFRLNRTDLEAEVNSHQQLLCGCGADSNS